MSALDDLRSYARDFAADISSLLNQTVTDGMRLGAVIHHVEGRDVCIVGRGITKRDPIAGTIPLTLGSKKAGAHLLVGFTLDWDPEQDYTAVTKSQVGLYADPEGEKMVFHYDYERDPDHRYPEAHLQIAGESAAFDGVRGEDTPTELERLHLPVGGRRYRPSLEDVIEFLVIEGIAEGRQGWKGVVDEHRATWEAKQLGAAVRRDRETAAKQLRLDGWSVTPPPPDAGPTP